MNNYLSDIIEKSKKTENLFFYDKFEFNNSKYFLYILPVWFNNQWSGHIGIFTKRKIVNRYVVALLHNFENHILDDLIETTLKNYNRFLLREMIKDIDLFSNKITNKQYQNILEYQYEVINYLVKKLDLLGGIFISSYSMESAYFFNSNEITEPNEIVKYFDNRKVITREAIYSDIDIPNAGVIKFIFCVPIVITEITGVLYLFDNTNSKLNAYFEIISDLV